MDKRIFFFSSIAIVLPKLIRQDKVIIIDKKTGQAARKIFLKHRRWGISSYLSYYEFESGEDIITEDMVLGL